jgi:hypothetical protein
MLMMIYYSVRKVSGIFVCEYLVDFDDARLNEADTFIRVREVFPVCQ